MPNLITNPIGFTLDPLDAIVLDVAGSGFSKGDVVLLRTVIAEDGVGLNTCIIVVQTTEDHSPILAVVLEASAAVADTPVRVRLRGQVDCQIDDDTSAITQASPALISSLHSDESALTDSLSPASTADAVAGGNASIKIIGIYIGTSGTAATNGVTVDLVLFDGLNGFGMANAALS